MAGLSQVVVQVGQASLANAMWLSNFGVLLFKPLPGKKAVTESPIPLSIAARKTQQSQRGSCRSVPHYASLK